MQMLSITKFLILVLILTSSIAHGQTEVLEKLWVCQRPLKVNEKITLQAFSLYLDSAEKFAVDEWLTGATVTEKINKEGAHEATSASFLVLGDEIYFHIQMDYWNFKKGDDFGITYLLTKKDGNEVLFVETDLDSGFFYLTQQ